MRSATLSPRSCALPIEDRDGRLAVTTKAKRRPQGAPLAIRSYVMPGQASAVSVFSVGG